MALIERNHVIEKLTASPNSIWSEPWLLRRNGERNYVGVSLGCQDI
jgi:hypothetical protein